MQVEISEGHPLASCLVRLQVSSGAIPLRLTDVLLNEVQGCRLSYLGEPDVVVEGSAEFAMQVLLTTDLAEGSKLQNIGWEFVFQPAYFTD